MAVRLADSTLRSGEPATWGSGQQKLTCSWETWALFNERIRPSMQREELPTMETGLEQIAAKARSEPKLRFTSLAHRVTRERVWENLCQIPKDSSPGVDGQSVPEAKESFGEWIEEMLQSMHRQGYPAPVAGRKAVKRMRTTSVSFRTDRWHAEVPLGSRHSLAPTCVLIKPHHNLEYNRRSCMR